MAEEHKHPSYMAIFWYLTILTVVELIVIYLPLPKFTIGVLLCALVNSWVRYIRLGHKLRRRSVHPLFMEQCFDNACIVSRCGHINLPKIRTGLLAIVRPVYDKADVVAMGSPIW